MVCVDNLSWFLVSEFILVGESHGEFLCHMHHHIFAVCGAVRIVIERSVHHQSHDAVDNELCIGALCGPFGAAPCVSRMLKTRWFVSD